MSTIKIYTTLGYIVIVVYIFIVKMFHQEVSIETIKLIFSRFILCSPQESGCTLFILLHSLCLICMCKEWFWYFLITSAFTFYMLPFLFRSIVRVFCSCNSLVVFVVIMTPLRYLNLFMCSIFSNTITDQFALCGTSSRVFWPAFG